MNTYFVYIVASQKNGTIYTGVTNDLIRRSWEHKHGVADGFTRKYNCKRLVWYETHTDIEAAIIREKRIKRWRRKWKLELIEERNWYWRDLTDDLVVHQSL